MASVLVKGSQKILLTNTCGSVIPLKTKLFTDESVKEDREIFYVFFWGGFTVAPDRKYSHRSNSKEFN